MWRNAKLIFLLTLLSACSQGGESVMQVKAADPQSPYAQQLAPCTREGGDQRSCRLQQLPLLGMQIEQPSKADIMARVATTHLWMAQRFSELLDAMPAEMYQLMRSVSAIIIGADVRPSFYWQHTGAIYLDPAGLWLTVEEKRSIDPAPDYRQNFGQALQFNVISRYVRDNAYAWYGYSLEDESERELDDIILPMARLLFHELAHAGDFFPQNSLSGLSSQLTVAQAADQIERQQQQISQDLQARFPLQSQLYAELAEVRFLGREARPSEASLKAEEVVAEYRDDGSNDDYAYTSRFEDVAMLFEETMMAMSFAVERDIAIAPVPAAGENHIVEWGQRRRIRAPEVEQRARFVAQSLLPDAAVDAFFVQYSAAQSLRSGASWNDNLDPDGNAAKRLPAGLYQNNPRDEVR
ncbi:MAG: hypothetical protein ACSHXK_06660 [Oceanococcus sp.]